jgi:asparagine synthase (glutamine-hydrolysing)
MVDMIRHRGPDASGVYTDSPVGSGGAVGLAHARLSIIRKGYEFATHSDTEVILHMYEDKGEECVRHFNGQWAFAIWDAKRRRLFLSRDRVGVRPLFYALPAGALVFASEIKSILAHPAVERVIDLEALDQVFTFWHAVPPRTMFKGIGELPPGHSMSVEDGKVRVWPYWRLDYSHICHQMGEEECAGRLLELLSDATRIRLRSDVPVGAYLSGGLDSSVITALIKQCSQTRLKTFSVTFEDAEFDERAYQQEVVDFLGRPAPPDSVATTHQERDRAVAAVYPDGGRGGEIRV